jgi:hypothetical protein
MELLANFLGWFFIGSLAFIGLCAIVIPACWVYDSKFLSFKRMLKFARKWHRYEITKTSNMFGIYSWEKNFVSSYTPLAKNPAHALERYFRHYYRKNKERATGSMNSPCETTYEWATYMVKDITTDYKTYFR